MRNIFIGFENNRLPLKVQSLKKPLIGREEVSRLLRDNAFAFGFGCGSRGGRQKRALGKKSRKDNMGGQRVPERPEGAVKPEFHTVA